MRNNIERSVIKKGKQWDNIPFWDIIIGDFKMKVFGYKVFSSLWSGWTQVRELLSCRNATRGPPNFIVIDRSIYWGLYLNNKLLALTLSCSTKKWNEKGISLIRDLMVNDRFGSWDEISKRFDIPKTQRKKYTLLEKVLCLEKGGKFIDNKSFIRNLKWNDGTNIGNTYVKQIYDMFKKDQFVLQLIVDCWGLICPFSNWRFFFDYLWKCPCEPKVIHFRWFLLLKKLSIGPVLSSVNVDPMICNLYNKPESFEHVFFECIFASKIWAIFFIDFLLFGIRRIVFLGVKSWLVI